MAVVGFTIVGFGLLWWAGEQLDTIRDESGRTATWQTRLVLVWIMTLVAAGAMFSVATSATRTGESRARLAPTLVAAALPVAVIVYYWAAIPFEWVRIGWGIQHWILSDETPIVASSFIVGFLLAGLATSRVNWNLIVAGSENTRPEGSKSNACTVA